jgi:branched-chain amino acid transport system ATP-binding protein
MLRLDGVSASYGPIAALHDVSLSIDEGQIVCLLGANGAGKSSTLRLISGLLRPTDGTVEFAGERIDRYSPERIVATGISHVPEGRQLFTDLTVRENLVLGAYTRKDGGAARSDLQRMFGYFPVLERKQEEVAGSLSGGEQQMLAMARGLMCRPRLLLLDEPSIGLAPIIAQEIFRILTRVNHEDGLTVLVVEQNASLALSVAHFGYVLETGRIVIGEPAAALKQNQAVRQSYLGY